MKKCKKIDIALGIVFKLRNDYKFATGLKSLIRLNFQDTHTYIGSHLGSLIAKSWRGVNQSHDIREPTFFVLTSE